MNHGTIRIGLTFDLRDEYLKAGYSEDETAEFDRAETIDAIESTLQSLGYETDRIGNIKQLTARLVDGDRWDLVFNICEGMYGIGREAQVPALLDAYQIPYTFSDALASELIINGRIEEIVKDLKKQYDVIIIDNPPVGLVTDGISIIQKADYPIYIFRAEYSKKNFIQNVDRLFNEFRLNRLSIVLNGVDINKRTYGYNYGYGYGYGYAYTSSYGAYYEEQNRKKKSKKSVKNIIKKAKN